MKRKLLPTAQAHCGGSSTPDRVRPESGLPVYSHQSRSRLTVFLTNRRGYQSHAAYATEPLLAGHPDAVRFALRGLRCETNERGGRTASALTATTARTGARTWETERFWIVSVY